MASSNPFGVNDRRGSPATKRVTLPGPPAPHPSIERSRKSFEQSIAQQKSENNAARTKLDGPVSPPSSLNPNGKDSGSF